ncbi:MAG: mannose-1-phosphate guanyltransferase [Elusimicrobiota bacterium]|jgi:mannose-1-phosphate guanylyltransferase/phosphomannomutase|nr:mannose-1-phosphate guanyltransferase [Elusimicrobiota bacterium]
MQAIIMAGGFGTRLRPITCNTPKPMAPVANKPMLEHIINLLKQHKIDDLTMLLYYQPDVIKDYFKNGKDFSVKTSYMRPESDLGTAGSVKFAQDKIKNTFIVISGDVLTDFDLTEAIKFHKSKKAIATMVLTRVANPLQFGVVITDQHGKIERFLEKPSWGEVFSDTINTGIYILEPKVFNYMPKDESFDFSKDLFPLLLKEKKPLYGYIAEGYWRDIGNHDEYRFAHYDILDGNVKIELNGKKIKIGGKDIIIGENVEIGKEVDIDSNVILGDRVIIKNGAKISRSVIGSNVTVGEGAEVVGAIVWDDVSIGTKARIKENVIGRRTVIGDRSVVQVGTIISDDCIIKSDAIIKPNLRIWPHKIIESGAILSSSLVWGEKWNKALFNATGITGLGNVEITPEFAAKIGSAYGAYIGKDAYIVTSRDAHYATRMIKRAFVSGLLSAGVKVGDLSTSPVPVTRYEIGNEGEAGGVHIRQSPLDGLMIDIKFFNAKGRDISLNQEKAIEQLFFREDFKRAKMDEVGEITVPPRAVEYYKSGYLNTINKGLISNAKQQIVIDYSYSSAAMIFPSILGELAIEVVALNAHTKTTGLIRTSEEFNNSLSQLSHIVTTLKSTAGFLIDNGAEKVFLIDEKGQIIHNDIAMFIAAYLTMKANKVKDAIIAVPVYASCAIEKVAAKFKIKVKRTGTSPRSIIDASINEKAIFVGDSSGGFIFPEFQNTFDAMYAIGKIVEMLVGANTTLSQVEKELPKFSVLHKAVPCSWDKKGQVMRKAIEHAVDKKHELIDGVKLYFKEDWVLLIPDPDGAVFHIWAETKNPANASKLLENYAAKIKKWQE